MLKLGPLVDSINLQPYGGHQFSLAVLQPRAAPCARFEIGFQSTRSIKLHKSAMNLDSSFLSKTGGKQRIEKHVGQLRDLDECVRIQTCLLRL